MLSRSVLPLATASLLTLAACDGAGGAGDTQLRHGDIEFQDLTASELAEVCQDAEALTRSLLDDERVVNGLVHSVCYLVLTMDAESTCTDASLDRCVADLMADPDAEVTSEDTTCGLTQEKAAGCDVTVAEFESCTRTMHEALAVMADATCADLVARGDNVIPAGHEDLRARLARCDELDTRCPGLFSDEDEDESPQP